MLQLFHYNAPLSLESGADLSSCTIAYQTFGVLNKQKSNVVWVCHALTASADVGDWWSALIGAGNVIDTNKYFVVCANIIGSCYGSTGPLTINPTTGKSYYHSFPLITIRDMVQAHILLRQHLSIDTIHLLMGGSMGGYQVLEWALMEKNIIQNLFLIATSAAESAWGIAIHTAQRLAIEADSTWQEQTHDAGAKGLKAARAIGMLSYRNYKMYEQMQHDVDNTKLDHFRASSYIIYQGEKLVNRFNAYSYWTLSKAMDAHNISRNRAADCAGVLQTLTQPTLLMGISTDILCPIEEQRFMAAHIPNVQYHEIESPYGHDGFLIEANKIAEYLKPWLEHKMKI
jgi:homoserine O-acetyltransferase/O-succinyltransferase